MRMRSKISAIVLAFAMLVGFGCNSFAKTAPNYSTVPGISDILAFYNVEISSERILFLKGADGIDRYAYIPLKGTGYIIYDTDKSIVIEYSVESDNTYVEKSAKGNIYYIGPLEYYKADGSKMVSLVTGETVGTIETVADIERAINVKTQIASKTAPVMRAASSTEYYISGKVPSYGYNVGGICGANAASMWLKWYDNNVNGNYVPASLTSTSGQTLIKHMASYIPAGSGTGGKIAGGIYSYLKTQGINHFPLSEYANEETVTSAVSGQRRPYSLGLVGHPTYGNHWVTGYGYSQLGVGTIYAIVNDGHGGTGVHIVMSYTDYIVH